MPMPERYSGKRYQLPSMPRNSMIYEMMDIANNCLDSIYSLTKPNYPEVKKPLLVLDDINELNAYATYIDGRPSIIINSKLLVEAKDYLYTHLKDSTIEKIIGIDENYTSDHIRKKILVYFIRFTVLHELFHLWHGHLDYLSNLGAGTSLGEKRDESDQGEKLFHQLGNGVYFEAITLNALKQSFEYDADISAANMLFNLLCQQYDMNSPEAINFRKETLLLFAGILSMFFLFTEKNADENVTFATKVLMKDTHPVPSIRYYYCEAVLAAKLFDRLGFDQTIEFSNLLAPIVFDLFADENEPQPFQSNPLLTAYTYKAQDHFLTLKKVFAQIYDALLPFVKSNIIDKPFEDFLQLHGDAIRFDKDGNDLLSQEPT